jgi:hypothetical protein
VKRSWTLRTNLQGNCGRADTLIGPPNAVKAPPVDRALFNQHFQVMMPAAGYTYFRAREPNAPPGDAFHVQGEPDEQQARMEMDLDAAEDGTAVFSRDV